MERDIGRALRETREQVGLSRETLAARMGLRPDQLKRMEEATNVLTASRLEAAARELGVRVGHFYGGHDPMRVASCPPGIPPLMDHPESHDLMQAYAAAPREVRKNFAALLEVLARR
nr:helix-turn-helix transcriptional regulator [Roseospira navarrensis]